MINVLQCSLLAFVCLLATSHGQKVNVTLSNSIAEHILDLALRLGNNLNFTESATISPVTIVSSLGSIMIGMDDEDNNELVELFKESDLVKFFLQLRLMLNDAKEVDPNKISPLRKRDPWQENSRFTYGKLKEVKFDNGIFIQTGYKLPANYENLVKYHFGTKMAYLDFQDEPDISKKVIDNWLLETNENNFKVEFDRPRMFVVNTFWFNASLDDEILTSSSSRLASFYPNGLNKDPVLAHMMFLTGTFPSYEDKKLGIRILGIPYSSSMNTMYIIQPLNSNKKSLKALQSKLSGKKIEQLIAKMEKRVTEITLPYLDLNNSFDLAEPLSETNFSTIFEENDITASIPRKIFDTLPVIELATKLIQILNKAYMDADLFVTDFKHHVTVTVSEDVTSAKGGNAINAKSGPDVHFNVNTPFLLLIRNDLTRLPLVYSIINKP